MPHGHAPRHATPLSLGLAAVLSAPLIVLAAPRSDTVAVVGPPGATFSDIAAIGVAAEGGVLRVGRWSNIVVARSDRSGFVARLYAAGAWLVVDPLAAGGCASEPPPPHAHAMLVRQVLP